MFIYNTRTTFYTIPFYKFNIKVLKNDVINEVIPEKK